MTIPYFEVTAFARQPFAGNPAAVCLLEKEWLPDPLLQQIATENNLAETAFVIARESSFDLRWMTPKVEVDLCGHATLAAAHVLFEHAGYAGQVVTFQSKSGELRVARENGMLVLDFPVQSLTATAIPDGLTKALGAEAQFAFRGRDYFAIFEREEEVAAIRPDFDLLAALDVQGVVATAPGRVADFVSRYFAPAAGIPEDPVTGSTHCALIPYWAARLGKEKLTARQISERGGELFCQDRGARVSIGGHALTYVEGKIHL